MDVYPELVIVLSALEEMKKQGSDLTNDAKENREDIVRLYLGTKQVWVDSGHATPLEKPEALIYAIREVLAAK